MHYHQDIIGTELFIYNVLTSLFDQNSLSALFATSVSPSWSLINSASILILLCRYRNLLLLYAVSFFFLFSSPANPPGSTFIPLLDSHLRLARPPLSSASSTLSKPYTRFKPLQSSLRRGELIEINAPTKVGKSELVGFEIGVALLDGWAQVSRSGRRNDDMSKQENPAEEERWVLKSGGAAGVPKPTIDAGDGPQSSLTKVIDLHGKSQNVILIIPSSYASPLPRLVRFLKSHIKHCFSKGLSFPSSSLPSNSKSLSNEIIHNTLKRLTIVRLPPNLPLPTHLPTLSQNLPSLPTNLSTDLFDHQIPLPLSPYASLLNALLAIPVHAKTLDGELGLLVIEGFGDGFWEDRWRKECKIANSEAEAERAGRGREVNDQNLAQMDATTILKTTRIKDESNTELDHVLQAMTSVRKELGSIVLVTTRSMFRNESKKRSFSPTGSLFPNNSPLYTSLLTETQKTSTTSSPISPVCWPLSFHITLFPPSSTIKQLRSELTLIEALAEEEEKRGKARRDIGVGGEVRVVAMHGGAHTREGHNQVESLVGKFGFGIGGDGVEV